jgi:hypothetical protein
LTLTREPHNYRVELVGLYKRGERGKVAKRTDAHLYIDWEDFRQRWKFEKLKPSKLLPQGVERGMFEGRAAIGYDHGYDGEIFYLGLALDPAYVEGWVDGCLERIGEDDPDEEQVFRDLWEDETQRDVVVDCLKADCKVRAGRPPDL